MGDGQQANNPWLQEFPDPITRVSWDNYVTVSNADAKLLEMSNEIVANGGRTEVMLQLLQLMV
jgi:molybdopterin-containing oxidoreductase family iron-sulfur binding subunit